MTSLVADKAWSGSPRKIAAREWFIRRYREIFNVTRMPPGYQYWTLAGNLADKGKLGVGTELDQVIKEGLITPDQYHGAEVIRKVYESNLTVLPKGAHLYHNDLVSQITTAYRQGALSPGIIHYDTHQFAHTALEHLCRLMAELAASDTHPLLVVNLVRSFMYRTGTSQDVVDELTQNEAFRHWWSRGGWHLPEAGFAYSYDGTGRTSAKMTTLLFLR